VSTRCGQLLIAASSLHDPNFARTVVLIVKDDENGTFGLVLNRPLETSVKDACASAMEIDCQIDVPLHLGGPCEGIVSVVHSQPDLGELEIFSGIYFTTERDRIECLMADNPTPAKYFAGYAGWSAGQLDQELEAGAWLLTSADRRYIFNDEKDLWNRVITQITVGRWINVDQMPDDPSVN
jgi:putative transcriptional regulator